MNHREYKRLRAQVENEYHTKLQALEMVYQMSKGSVQASTSSVEKKARAPEPPPANTETAAKDLLAFTPPPSTPSPTTGLANAVRDAVKQIEGEFTLNDLDERVRMVLPGARTPSISNVLIRLIDKQQVLVVTKRMGKSPAVYRRA